MVTTIRREITSLHRQEVLLGNENVQHMNYQLVNMSLFLKTRRKFISMKKYIIVFAIISTLAISFVSEQVSALPLPIAEFDSELVFQSEPESSTTIYKVQPGDTLWAIAQENDVTVEDLVSWNELNSSLIHPDQEIKIKRRGSGERV